ncbi:MAG: sugar phosphate isomerase/epimerase [Planctomycetes bacterium]|nr:sugar phosphate isomerase/epimerase [Planctomycetota bacterium]
MYVAVHSWSFRERFKQDKSFNIFQAMDIAARAGFKGMEIMTGKANMPVADIGADTVEGLKKVLDYAKKCGLKIHSYATFNDFAYVKDETWRLANIEYIKKWLGLAGDTGVPNIRMLTGYYVEGEDRKRLEDMTLKGIEECIPVAEKAGVNMAIENHNSIFMKGDEIAGLIKRFGSKRLTACPDPSNGCPKFFDPACTPEARDGVYENLKVMAPYATASHLKIRGFNPDGSLLGWDMPRLLGIYRKAGFDGSLTFESIVDGDLIAPLAKAREVVEKAIAASA